MPSQTRLFCVVQAFEVTPSSRGSFTNKVEEPSCTKAPEDVADGLRLSLVDHEPPIEVVWAFLMAILDITEPEPRCVALLAVPNHLVTWRTGRGSERATGSDDTDPAVVDFPVANLVARSLFAADANGPVVYYRLLETTRVYALEKLQESGELPIGRRTSESFTVRGARLTMGLQIQEATLRCFFERSGVLARGIGFLARFLVAWPESIQGFRPFTEAPSAWPNLSAYHQGVAGILKQPVPIDDDGALTPPMLPVTVKAKAEWVAYHDAIERKLRNGGELYDVRDVASKGADNAARLGAQFQVFEHGMGGAVGLEAFEGASRIAAWHLNDSRRFFGELALPQELAGAGRLDGWLIEYCRREQTQQVPVSAIQKSGPGTLRAKTAMEPALRELEELNRVRFERGAGKDKIVRVNPSLLEACG